MILSHRHKFIFFCNGKTGSTSIEHALSPYQEGAALDVGMHGVFVPKHIPPAILKACLPEPVWREYFKLVFVRNPWDWFVSQWQYNFVTLRRPLPPRGRVARIRNLVPARARSGGQDVRPAAKIFGAAEVDLLFDHLRQFRGLPGSDGLYQSNYVHDMDGRRVVDFVGRFETLEQDFAAISERIRVPLQLPHLNRTERNDYRSSFSEEGRLRVAQRWAVDVDNFGYEFDGRGGTAAG